MLDKIFLLLTGLLAAYLCWYFYRRYTLNKALHNLYYLMGFAVLLVSGLLLHLPRPGHPHVALRADGRQPDPAGHLDGHRRGILPRLEEVLQVVRPDRLPGDCHDQHRRAWTRLKKIAVPLFHGVAGLVIFLGPFLAKGAPKGFFWVGIGGLLIGLGGIALAFISVGTQLLFFSPEFRHARSSHPCSS